MAGTIGKETRLQALASLISQELDKAPPRPKLRLIRRSDLEPAPEGMDPLTRNMHYQRIRDMARMYWLAWLVRQETEHVGGTIECLSDPELLELRAKMEKAWECRVEGISFDDAGLVRHKGE